MNILNPKSLAFWITLGAVAFAAGAYARTSEGATGEITEEESREVADLIQPKAEPQPAPQADGKEIQRPLKAPRARLVTPKEEPAARQTTALNP